jgi:transcriptional regulator with PAS, ATPase and Fis domain
VQAQFLKVLEEKSYRRLGDVKLYRSEFRLLCATNRDVEEMVAGGMFRQDLLYRVNLIVIRIPPLRERLPELPQLVTHLMQTLNAADRAIDDEVMPLLSAYAWPGNLREMRNVLERALLLSRGGRLVPEHFSGLAARTGGNGSTPGTTVQEIEERHIVKVLDQVGGNIDLAAKALNLSRATLYRRLRQMRERQG